MVNTAAKKKSRMSFGSYWERFGTLSILLLILIGFSIASPNYFLSVNNIKQIGMQSTIYTVLAFGEFFAILLAGIDLSVGSVAAFCGAVCAKLLLVNCPVWAAVLIGLLVGVALGAINGTLINLLQLHPFVVTLGTSTIFRGIVGDVQRKADLWLAPWIQVHCPVRWRVPDPLSDRAGHCGHFDLVHQVHHRGAQYVRPGGKQAGGLVFRYQYQEVYPAGPYSLLDPCGHCGHHHDGPGRRGRAHGG